MTNQAEQDEARAAFRKASVMQLVSMFPEDRRSKLFSAVGTSILTMRELFPGMTQEQQAGVAEAIGSTISQLMSVQAYALSDTLEYTMDAYLVASAVLYGDYEVPEVRADEPGDELDVEKLKADFKEAVAGGAMTVLDLSPDDDDDPLTGMYL